ncbi:uromodulin-like [Styela clava]
MVATKSKFLLVISLLIAFVPIISSQAIAVFIIPTCENGTAVDNTTACDHFATRTYLNSTHECCECEADFTGDGISCQLATKLDCSMASLNDGYAFRVFLNQSYIDYNNISTSSLRLMNASCNNVTLDAGYYVLWSPAYDDCGSIRTNTSSNLIYSNAVTSDGGTIATGLVIKIDFQCVVSASLALGLSNADGLLTVQDVTSDSIVFPIQEGNGHVTAAMYLFKDSDYNEAYNGVPVLSTSDMLYVMIALDGNALSNLYMISRECWATPDAAGVSSERFDIIEQPGCLKSGVIGAAVTSNGVSSNVKFQLSVFAFLPSNVVYLHCAVQLCTGSDCAPTCSSRKKRETNLQVQILRSSLIIRSNEKIREPPNIGDGSTNNNDLVSSNNVMIIIILLVLTGVLLIAIIALLIYVCVTRRRKST